MRKVIFIGITALGALVGLFSAAMDDWGTRIVMMGVGMLFAAPVGGALASIGKKGRKAESNTDFDWESNRLPGLSMSPIDLAANYWRDKGHPPFAKPSEAEPDKHQFDPKNIT